MTMIFSGHPVEDMETAKRMIANYPNVDLTDLIAVATDRTQPRSARIAAIYTLGFTDDHGISSAALARIVGNTDEPDDVRDHANEALESIQSHH
jgi:hypothetical protein